MCAFWRERITGRAAEGAECSQRETASSRVRRAAAASSSAVPRATRAAGRTRRSRGAGPAPERPAAARRPAPACTRCRRRAVAPRRRRCTPAARTRAPRTLSAARTAPTHTHPNRIHCSVYCMSILLKIVVKSSLDAEQLSTELQYIRSNAQRISSASGSQVRPRRSTSPPVVY